MNVLLIGTVPPRFGSQNYGGVAQVVWKLAEVMNISCGLTIGAIGRYTRGEQTVEGIRIIGAAFSARALWDIFKIVWRGNFFPNQPIAYNLRLLFAAYVLRLMQLRNIPFDLIHVHHVHNQIPLAAKILGLNVPVVATLHSYHDLVMAKSARKKKRLLEVINIQLECVDLLTQVSSAMREQGASLGAHWDCPDKVVYNGVEFLDAPPASNSLKRVCFVGSFIERKGVVSLIEALSLMKAEDLDCIVWLGTGELQTRIEAATARFKFKSEMRGYLNHQEALAYMAESAILVVPSISESFGLVYIEALYAGTPVIGYHAVIREFRALFGVGPEFDDWLQPHDALSESPAMLAEKIKKALQIKRRTTYLRERQEIQNIIRKHFAWESIAAQYLQIYTDLLKNKR